MSSRRLALPAALGGLSAGPIVGAMRQDRVASMIAAAPAFTVVLLTFLIVIGPAVLARSHARRSAALTVLDRLLGGPVRNGRGAR
jgi:hypothetical protein